MTKEIRQCPSCGGFCKKSGCERANTDPPAAQWDKPSANFNAWWDSNVMPPANPFAEGSAAYWAWSGWKAAQRQWQGLTDEELQFYIKMHSKLVNASYDKVTDTNILTKTFDSTGFYKEVSTVLKERNT